MKVVKTLMFGFLFVSAHAWAAVPTESHGFETSLRALARELTIPGLAFAVVRNGKVISSGQLNPDSKTMPLTIDMPLRFASVTKALTAVALMRAVDRGALSLDDSAGKWLPELRTYPQITVRHLAAHVSEGLPGTEYVYGTNRYAKLAPVLMQVLGVKSFEDVLRAEIVIPSGMTWHDSPNLGAHAGFVSTVNDMALFVQALQGGRLLSKKRFDEMTTPFKSRGAALPVGVGFFSQQLEGERVAWSFGQDDPDHSSALLLMLPKRRLALVLLANTDELSNPFRLLMGDVRYSPFATAFLDAFAPAVGKGIGERERLTQSALISVWNQNGANATAAFNKLASLGEPRADDLVPHFLATMVGDFESMAYVDKLDAAVSGAHRANRWALLASGELNERLNRPAESAQRFEAILTLPNQEADGLATLFRAWSFAGLARVYKDSDRQRAIQYVQQGLATGVTGGTRGDLLDLGNALEAPSSY
jgi:CubicO group peptidase (beta-lactamase class C family)